MTPCIWNTTLFPIIPEEKCSLLLVTSHEDKIPHNHRPENHISPFSTRAEELMMTFITTALSYDAVNGIFTRYSTAYLAIIPTDNLSVVSFLNITVLEAYYEITVSLQIHAMNFKSF